MPKYKGYKVYIPEKPSNDIPLNVSPGHIQIDKLTEKALIRNYLCRGIKSLCVVKHQCENLSICYYGKRYIELLESKNGK